MKNDPIGDYLLSDSRYRGVLVEPIPHYACLLKNNHGPTGRFTIEQVAIAAYSDVIKMYHVAENASELLGKGFDVTAFRGIASLDRNHLVKHLPAGYDCIIEETSVESVTVKELLNRSQIKQIDLLHIDAEGYDWIILRQFDFNLIRPRIVLFERKHLNKKTKTLPEA